jgi:hypothetical protein
MTSPARRSLLSSAPVFAVVTAALAGGLAMRWATDRANGPTGSVPADARAGERAPVERGAKRQGGGQPPPRFENCQIEVARLSAEIERLDRIAARVKPPFQVYASSQLNPELTAATKAEVDRFLGERPGRYAAAQVECHADACLITGPTGYLPELMADEWFRARVSGANPGGNKVYLRMATSATRDAAEVVDAVLARVKEHATEQCAKGTESEYRITVRESIIAGRHQLSVETEGTVPAREQCVVGLMQQVFAQTDLSGLTGRGLTRVQRL